MTTAAEWDYFTEGRHLYDTSSWLRKRAHVVDHPVDEPLIASRTFCYHDGGQDVAHLSTELIDYYRCWPCADPHSESVAAITADGAITTPLVIYSDGSRAVLGEGNHRLAAAKAMGLSLLPVVVIPDRLGLEPGVTAVPVDPDVAGLVERVSRSHHGASADLSVLRHRLSTHTEFGQVFVFCACGAHWRREDH